LKLFLHKLTHWEYWPYGIVYIPMYFLLFYYALRARTLFFFNATNPSIKNGGFFNESKFEIYNIIPQQYFPKTELIKEGTSFENVTETLKKSQIKFPFIAKPDIGLRGSAVKKINTIDDLKIYNEKANFDYLLQNLIPYNNEVGIFYVRYPPETSGEKTGKITGIVSKEFLIVKGNGKLTIEELLKQNPRFAFQLKTLQKEYGEKLTEILPKDEVLNLVPYGNHARGAKFIDASDKISEKLTANINEMCLQIPEFYFGRLDIMYDNWDDLENGKNFAIVELNGSGSEPTHIYDPKHSIFFAWKELARHFKYMFEIAIVNHKNGFAYLTKKEGIAEYKSHLKQSRKIVNF
jgi:hypothetical protein